MRAPHPGLRPESAQGGKEREFVEGAVLDEGAVALRHLRSVSIFEGRHMPGSPFRQPANRIFMLPTSIGANPMQSIYTFAKIFADRMAAGAEGQGR
ncbi:MAG: hypothetical protein ABSG65_07935 [Bryobacteraceae bacterium]|jgi:hypothetical protein